MKTIKKILVACDFSQYAKDTLEYAATCAQAHKSELVVVNVVNQRDIDTLLKVAQSQFDRTVEKYIEETAANYVENVTKLRTKELGSLIEELGIGHLKIKKVFETGPPLQKILETIDSESPDVVVMGPKGHENLAGVLFGSVAEKMFRRCPVPLLSVRPKTESLG